MSNTPSASGGVTAEEAIVWLRDSASACSLRGFHERAQRNRAIAALIEHLQRTSERYEEAGDALANRAEPFLSSEIVDETDGTVPLMNALDRAICEWRAIKGA